MGQQVEINLDPKKEKRRQERANKKRQKLMELIGEEAAKRVLAEDADVIVVENQGKREYLENNATAGTVASRQVPLHPSQITSSSAQKVQKSSKSSKTSSQPF